MQRQSRQLRKGKWRVEIVTEAHPYTQLWVRAACYRRALTLYRSTSKRHSAADPYPLQSRAAWRRPSIPGKGWHISCEIHRFKVVILQSGKDCGHNLRIGCCSIWRSTSSASLLTIDLNALLRRSFKFGNNIERPTKPENS